MGDSAMRPPQVFRATQIDAEFAPPGETASPEVIVRTPLGDKWEVTYRLTLQNGVPVIAELSIVPFGGTVPPGGLSARLVRTLKFTLPQKELKRFKEFGEKYPMEYDGKVWSNPTLAALGHKSAREYHRGRPDSFYAQIAKQYCKIVGSVRNPVRVIAKSIRQSPSKVRDMIWQARERGLLSKPAKQGRQGGILTPKCIAVLSATPAKARTTKRRIGSSGSKRTSRGEK